MRDALEIAAGFPIDVDRADAREWLPAQLAETQRGTATVVMHSVFWQYMPPESQAALAQVIDGHGAQAGPEAPFAWLRMEPAPDNMAVMELRLTLWPGGQEQLLAEVHPHGAWVKWRP